MERDFTFQKDLIAVNKQRKGKKVTIVDPKVVKHEEGIIEKEVIDTKHLIQPSVFTANEYANMLLGTTSQETLRNAVASMVHWGITVDDNELIIQSPDEYTLLTDYRMLRKLSIANGISKAHKEISNTFKKRLTTKKSFLI